MSYLTKTVVFALLVAQALAYNWPIIDGYPCPREDIVNTGCRGPKDCLYPNPRDCSRFIQCNDAGLAYDMPCAPGGLHWNDAIKQCDWPANANCVVTPDPTTPKPTTPEPTTKEPTTPKSTPKPTTTQRPTPYPDFECPLDDIANTQCMGPKDCLYPHPKDCNKFIQCEVNADGVTGRPTVKDCPADLEWNDNNKVCDWPVNSTCPNKPTQAPTETPTQPPTKPSTQPPTQPPTETPTPPTQTPTEESTPQACDCVCPTEGPVTTRRPRPTRPRPTRPRPTRPQPASTTPEPQGFQCPREDIVNTLCMGPKDCLYTNPKNCGTFIQCTVNPGNQSGTPIVMPCPAGLKWNDNEKQCDWPANATCRH